MQLRQKIRFFDENKSHYMIPVSQLKSLTGRAWFDFDYSQIAVEGGNKFLQSFLKDPYSITSSLEIRYMDYKSGYGLYAVNRIQKNTVIGFISGELKKLKSEDIDFDRENPTDSIKSGSISYDDHGNIFIIDSSRKSNHTHYIQHLPTKKKLAELGIPSKKRKEIADSNLSEKTIQHDGFDFTYFYANREIFPGEIIGCSYQVNEHEISMNTYSFFSKKGKFMDVEKLIHPDHIKSRKLP